MPQRKKREMKLIGDARRLRESFKNRLEGLVRKTAQLATLCDVGVFLVCVGPAAARSEVTTWPADGGAMADLVARYRATPPEKVKQDSTPRELLLEELAKQQRKLLKIKQGGADALTTWDGSLDDLSVDGLVALHGALDEALQRARHRMAALGAMSVHGGDGSGGGAVTPPMLDLPFDFPDAGGYEAPQYNYDSLGFPSPPAPVFQPLPLAIEMPPPSFSNFQMPPPQPAPVPLAIEMPPPSFSNFQMPPPQPAPVPLAIKMPPPSSSSFQMPQPLPVPMPLAIEMPPPPSLSNFQMPLPLPAPPLAGLSNVSMANPTFFMDNPLYTTNTIGNGAAATGFYNDIGMGQGFAAGDAYNDGLLGNDGFASVTGYDDLKPEMDANIWHVRALNDPVDAITLQMPHYLAELPDSSAKDGSFYGGF